MRNALPNLFYACVNLFCGDKQLSCYILREQDYVFQVVTWLYKYRNVVRCCSIWPHGGRQCQKNGRVDAVKHRASLGLPVLGSKCIPKHLNKEREENCITEVFHNLLTSESQAVMKVVYLPTDAQQNWFNKNIKIYIKTAPTCFGAITIIR